MKNKKGIIGVFAVLVLLLSGAFLMETSEFRNLGANISQVTYASEKKTTNAATNNKYLVQTVSTFTTQFTDYETGRNHNIALAAKSLNGQVVQPGEVFSFNDTVGPTTEANGFKLAKIFVDGEESEGFGGGVCQVSSTLFNSAERAGMEIVERHPHTKRVYYVPEGQDAATSYGKVDFKFKNTATVPIRISTLVEADFVTVNLDALNPLYPQSL